MWNQSHEVVCPAELTFFVVAKVERRNLKLVKTTAKSQGIVAKLFPDQVRDQLMAEEEENGNSARAENNEQGNKGKASNDPDEEEDEDWPLLLMRDPAREPIAATATSSLSALYPDFIPEKAYGADKFFNNEEVKKVRVLLLDA